MPPNKAERHFGALQLSKGKWIVLRTSATESRAYKGHLCHLTNSILFSHQFRFRIPPSNLKCIFSRPRFLSFVSLSEFPISKNMPIPLFFRVPPAASRRDPQTHVTKVRRSHDRQSPLLTPTRSALLYDPPLPSLLSPATSSRQILSATTTQFTTVTCYYDSLNGTNRHVPEFLRRDILIPRNDIADYFPSRLRDRGLASLTVTSVMSRQGAHAPRRRANQLPQATQQRVYSQPLRIYCLLFSLSYSYCTPYAFLLLGYDELVLIQNMLSLESLSLENLRFLIFVTVQQLSSDFLLSYALPFSTFLLVQLSKPVTIID